MRMRRTTMKKKKKTTMKRPAMAALSRPCQIMIGYVCSGENEQDNKQNMTDCV